MLHIIIMVLHIENNANTCQHNFDLFVVQSVHISTFEKYDQYKLSSSSSSSRSLDYTDKPAC